MPECPRIIVADDEQDIRHCMGRLLRRNDYDVIGSAANGHELVELCLSEKPDIVVTDIRMPELTGIEAAKRVRETLEIPFIVVSSHERPTEEDSQHIAAFLLKPVSIPDLLKTLKDVCRNASDS